MSSIPVDVVKNIFNWFLSLTTGKNLISGWSGGLSNILPVEANIGLSINLADGTVKTVTLAALLLSAGSSGLIIVKSS